MKRELKIFIILSAIILAIAAATLYIRSTESVDKKADLTAVYISDFFNGKDTYLDLLHTDNSKYLSQSFIDELGAITNEYLSKDSTINLSEIKALRLETSDIPEDGGGDADNSPHRDLGFTVPEDTKDSDELVELNSETSEETKETTTEESNSEVTEEIATEETTTGESSSEVTEEIVIEEPVSEVIEREIIFVNTGIESTEEVEPTPEEAESTPEEVEDNSEPYTSTEPETTEGVFEVDGEFFIKREDIKWELNGSAAIYFDNTNIIIYKADLEPTYAEITDSLSYTFVDYTLVEKDGFRYYTFESADKTNILNVTIQIGKNKLQHITLKIDKVNK